MAQAVKRAVKAAADAVAEIDAEIQGIEDEIAERHERLRALRRQRAEWAKLAAPPDQPAPEVAALNSAGPAAVQAVADYLCEHGTAYQFEITKATGLNSGTVTHSLRVLAHNHAIAATGRKRRNSGEFEWVAGRKTKAAATAASKA